MTATPFDLVYAETYGVPAGNNLLVRYLCHRCGRMLSRRYPCRTCGRRVGSWAMPDSRTVSEAVEATRERGA